MSCNDTAAAVGQGIDGDADGIGGQEVFYQFRPLDETEVATVEVVFVTHVVNFLYPLDAVEVEVIYK